MTAALAGAALVVSVALASHSEVSLPNSNFEIDTDANLKVDDTGDPLSIDWENVNEVRKADTASGSNDESFGQGTKEDTADPVVVDGSIPPNKSDLKHFGVYQEGSTQSGFLNLFWSRVQDPSGTTNMDFELNRRQCTPDQDPADTDCSNNGLTPKRTAGDVLIQYDLSQGGTNPVLFVSRWVTTGATSQCEASNKLPCWGDKTNLTAANDATGSINTTAIPANESDTPPLGAQDPRTFGEAQIKLSAIVPPGTCAAFGSAYLKSRSSDSFTAALKDFVPPAGISINSCGAIEITKTRKHAAAGTGNTRPHSGVTFKVEGPGLGQNGTTVVTGPPDFAAGKACLGGLEQGSYTVTETVPAGYKADQANPQTVVVDSTGSCSSGAETVSFSNTPLTDIIVRVDSKVDGGTASTIDCDADADPPFQKEVLATEPANGDGSLTLSDKEPGTYNCQIIVDP